MPEQSAEISPWKQCEFILKAFILLSRSHVRPTGFCRVEGLVLAGGRRLEMVLQYERVLCGSWFFARNLHRITGNLACYC